jgi:formamidopyrimidine-DNA glycosylase
MWAARLAPFARASALDDEEIARLARAADTVLEQALERARERITTDLPNREARVTAVHGHHGEPCLRCGTRLEHVAFAEYDLVYCPACQTGGRVYRDRRMSRLLGAP